MSSRMVEQESGPQTVDEARDAVQRSRQRISSTLDRLEDRIVDKKHEIQDRADVLRPVREQVTQRPFTAVAVAAGVGALLGSLGGGHEEDRGRSRHGVRESRHLLDEDDRAELRAWRRARRERLRSKMRDDGDADDSTASEVGSRLDDLRHQVMGALTSAVTAAATAKLKEFAGGGTDTSRRARADDTGPTVRT